MLLLRHEGLPSENLQCISDLNHLLSVHVNLELLGSSANLEISETAVKEADKDVHEETDASA